MVLIVIHVHIYVCVFKSCFFRIGVHLIFQNHFEFSVELFSYNGIKDLNPIGREKNKGAPRNANLDYLAVQKGLKETGVEML